MKFTFVKREDVLDSVVFLEFDPHSSSSSNEMLQRIAEKLKAIGVAQVVGIPKGYKIEIKNKKELDQEASEFMEALQKL